MWTDNMSCVDLDFYVSVVLRLAPVGQKGYALDRHEEYRSW
jgi:hypothetical protein